MNRKRQKGLSHANTDFDVQVVRSACCVRSHDWNDVGPRGVAPCLCALVFVH